MAEDKNTKQPDRPVARLRYFDNQFLQVADFEDAQMWPIACANWQNRHLRVAGVVEGLRVAYSQTWSVTVRAGTAIDAQGGLILLGADDTVDLQGKTQTQYIYISFQEVATGESTIVDGQGAAGNNRWTPKPILGTLNDRKDLPPGALLLASVGMTASGVDGNQIVDLRQPSGVRVPVMGAAAGPYAYVGTTPAAALVAAGPAGVQLGYFDSNLGPGSLAPVLSVASSGSQCNTALTVKGVLSAEGGLSVTGTLNAFGGLMIPINQGLTLNGTLTTSGAAVAVAAGKGLLVDTLTANGGNNANQNLTLQAKGTGSVLAGSDLAVGANGAARNLTVWGALTANGAINANAGLTVAANQTLTANGNLTVGGTVTANGALNANNDVTVKGKLTANGALNVSDDLTVNGNLNVGQTSNLKQEDWKDSELKNGWLPDLGDRNGVYKPPGYFKDSCGIVHLRGLVKSGDMSKEIFILDAGYRPEARQTFAVVSSNVAGRVDVHSDGRVFPSVGNNAWISLDGISFRAVPIRFIPIPIPVRPL